MIYLVTPDPHQMEIAMNSIGLAFLIGLLIAATIIFYYLAKYH